MRVRNTDPLCEVRSERFYPGYSIETLTCGHATIRPEGKKRTLMRRCMWCRRKRKPTSPEAKP